VFNLKSYLIGNEKMTKSVKTPAWAVAQITALTAAAETALNGKLSNEDLKILVATPEFSNKNLQEVRGKAVFMKVYQAAAEKRKVGGEPTQRKMQFVNAISTLTSCTSSLDSLEKASKPDLEALNSALVLMSATVDADTQELHETIADLRDQLEQFIED
jgi:hypothetical protein